MFVFKAAVLGTGTLGAGIAETIEAAGIPVVIRDLGGAYDGLKDVDLVIAVLPEELEEAQDVLAELDEVTPGRAILASGVTTLPITELGDATSRPDRVVGLHFFPAAGSRVVEVVEGESTSAQTMQAATTFVQRLRRTPIRCFDTAGTVVDRILQAVSPEDPSGERFRLKTLVEACLVVEEGVATMREVDLAAAALPGVKAPPFASADRVGLDQMLVRLERASVESGDQLEPPALLRRLVAQGRTGAASGQGFYPYPRPDEGWDDRPVKLETRDEIAIAWLDRPPANSISGEVVATLRELWDALASSNSTRALVIASANPRLFCAGADIKMFTEIDPSEIVDSMQALLRDFERSSIVTIAAVGALALGGGCELAMGCDLRIAAQSASFGQPEIGLGIIPGFGGTQRLPRLVGTSKALEMNLTGESIGAEEAYEVGLVNDIVPDEDLFDAALAWARRLALQPPLSVGAIKRVSGAGDLDAGIEDEKRAFAMVFASADAREGLSAFFEKRPPRFTGS